MAVDFTTNPGGFFPRAGRILRVAYLHSQYQATLPAAFTSLENQFEASLQTVGAIGVNAADEMTRLSSGVMGFAREQTEQLVIETVRADQPSQSLDWVQAMREVIRQMEAGGVTVKANTITATPTALSGNVGNGVLIVSTKGGHGKVQENAIPETLRLTCVRDSYTGDATQGQETFGLVGAPVLAGTWDYDWPRGSGAATTADSLSADQDAIETGNLLTNSDFEDWSDDATPELSNWTLETGAWGTDAQRSTDANRGSYALEFLPGATATAIYQEFDSDDGTTADPGALTSYAVNLWLRKVSGTISAGVLTVELVNAAGTVQNDEEGVANSFTVDLTALTTTHAAFNAVFRVNATPGTLRLRLRVSTALAGASFVADDVVFGPLTAFYPGGPGFATVSGATPFAGGDGWSIVVTNDYGGATYGATFQTGFDRVLNMRGNGLLLPSDAAPSIANTLITT